MIVLDTNVLSELVKPRPSVAVTQWFGSLSGVDVRIKAVTAAELLYGIVGMPRGSKSHSLATGLGELLDVTFREKILPFDYRASIEFADIAGRRRIAGRPIGSNDAMIAATVISAGAHQLVTRNTKDFADIGIELVNPWLP